MNSNARTFANMPSPDFQSQDVRFARAFSLIDSALAAHTFPAATLAVTHRGRLVAWRGFGQFTYDAESTIVSPVTIFDVASLTKVIATTAMAMLLYERGLLDLDLPVGSVLPEFTALADPHKRDVTVRMLLAHSSGLPDYERLFERAHNRDELIELAITMPLAAAP